MIDQSTKCDPEILFKITKKEADFVLNLPRFLQDEFEKYQKLVAQFQEQEKQTVAEPVESN
jgi:hypothetical protein